MKAVPVRIKVRTKVWSTARTKAPINAHAPAALRGPSFSLFRTAVMLGIVVFCLNRPDGILHAGAAVPDGLPNFPRTVVWAWERPEDLRFLNQAGEAIPQTGVAFLARTLYLRAGDVIVRPRFQPFRSLPGTPRMPVLPIEPRRVADFHLPKDQPNQLAGESAR